MPTPRRPSPPSSAWFYPLALSFCAIAIATSSAVALPITSSLSASSASLTLEPSLATTGGASVQREDRVRLLAVQLVDSAESRSALPGSRGPFSSRTTAETGRTISPSLSVNTGRLLAVKTSSMASLPARTKAAALAIDVSVDVEVPGGTSSPMTTLIRSVSSTSAPSSISSPLSASSSSVSSIITSRNTSTSVLSVSTTATNATFSSLSTDTRPSRTSRVSASVSSRIATSRTSVRSSSRSRASASTRSTSRETASTSTTTIDKVRVSSRLSSSSQAKSTKIAVGTKAIGTTSKTGTHKTPRPSPTSYGYSNLEKCTPASPTFAGTDAGFASLCKVRYCDVKARRNMVLDLNSTEVTRTEIESAIGMLAQLEPLWENGQGNVLADGYLGQGLYNAGLLFEITGDVRALDVVVRIADNILALQNQNTADPVTIWTGDVDPVWPTAELYPSDGGLVYAGSENGLIVGNMVSAAVMILKSPCLWNLVPPEFDGPTVFNNSVTYYDRAKAYIAAGDDTYENYFFRFLDPNLSIIQPADERWWATGDSRAPGTPMPWNRRMMMVHGYLRLAAAHETAAAFSPNKTAYYDSIVQQNVADFLGDLNETKAIRNGVTTFNWDYSYGEDHTEESQGVHAYFDIWGSWISWQRNSATFGLSNFIGQTFANTFENTIAFGNGTFSGLVTGSSTSKAYTINTLWGGWTFYSLWEPGWFTTVAQANIDTGFGGRTWLAIPLLWTKHALAIDDLTFWAGKFSSGFGEVVGTAPTAPASTSGASSILSSPALGVSLTLLAAILAFGAII
ncbi:hypothetical protein JCM11641_000742 [Rhodosporidiobolus odoratus]